MGEAKLALAVFIFADEEIIVDRFDRLFRAAKDEVCVAERVFEAVGGEAGRSIRRPRA